MHRLQPIAEILHYVQNDRGKEVQEKNLLPGF
jgi:hypothetical protein